MLKLFWSQLGAGSGPCLSKIPKGGGLLAHVYPAGTPLFSWASSSWMRGSRPCPALHWASGWLQRRVSLSCRAIVCLGLCWGDTQSRGGLGALQGGTLFWALCSLVASRVQVLSCSRADVLDLLSLTGVWGPCLLLLPRLRGEFWCGGVTGQSPSSVTLSPLCSLK